MAILHVRDVPDDLYESIQQLASTENRSLSAEVVELLNQAIARRGFHSEHKKVLAAIDHRRSALTRGGPSTLVLLREDRSRGAALLNGKS